MKKWIVFLLVWLVIMLVLSIGRSDAADSQNIDEMPSKKQSVSNFQFDSVLDVRQEIKISSLTERADDLEKTKVSKTNFDLVMKGISQDLQFNFDDMERKFIVIFVLILLLILFLIFACLYSSQRNRGIDEVVKEYYKEGTSLTGPLKKEDADRLDKMSRLEVEVQGGIFLISCWAGVNKDGSRCYYSPFLTTKGDWIVRHKGAMVRSLRSCMIKDDYKKQRENLEELKTPEGLKWIEKIS